MRGPATRPPSSITCWPAAPALRRQSLEPPEWRAGSHLGGVTTWLTVAEMRQVTDELVAISLRYADRFKDPSLRPSGSREAWIFTVTSVAPPPPRPR